MLLDPQRHVRYLTVSASSLLSFSDPQKSHHFGGNSHCESNEANAWTTSPNSPASIFYKNDKGFDDRTNSSSGEDYFYFQEKKCNMNNLVRTGLVVLGCVLICGSVAAFVYVKEKERQPLNNGMSKLENAKPNNESDTRNNFTTHNETNGPFKISIERFLAAKRIAPPKAEKFIWLKDGTLLLRDSESLDYLKIYVNENSQRSDDSAEGITREISSILFLADADILKAVGALYSEVNFNHNGSFAAIYMYSKKVFRHSQKMTVKIAEVTGKKNETQLKIVHDLKNVQLFEWTSYTNEYVYVSDNQIYYCSEPQCKNLIAITSKSKNYKDFLYNGITDWVYEEEIFGTSKALWWSDTDEYLAFMRVDDSNVTKVQIPYHKPFIPYPTYESIPYPETGTKNIPDVSLWIWSKKSKHSRMVMPPKQLVEAEDGYLLFWANWVRLDGRDDESTEDQLISIWANREQSLVIISICSKMPNNFIQQTRDESLICDTLTVLDYTDVKGMHLWAEPKNFQIQFFSNNGLFAILPNVLAEQKFSSLLNNSNHNIENDDNRFTSQTEADNVYDVVAHIDIRSGEVTSIHGANYDVIKLLGYDWKGDNLFFSSGGGTLGETHIFHVPTAAGASSIPPQCITCLGHYEESNYGDISSTDIGAQKWCAHHFITVFSQDSSRFVLQCTQPFFGWKTFLKEADNIEENIPLSEYHTNVVSTDSIINNSEPNVTIPIIRFLKLQTSKKDEAHVRIIHSPELDLNIRNATNLKQYPVLLYVYGGPNTIQSLKTIPQPILSYFAVMKNAFVVTIDARGSARRGWRLRSKLYANFGNIEVEDQIDVLRKVIAKYKWIMDAKRVAVFGWSYGGFAAISIAQRDSGLTVQCAAAVAPVTDFRFYDSVYTERYMGLLNKDSKTRYVRASLLNSTAIEVFREQVKLFLAHGLADDNVHYHNSALLSAMLQEQNIHFHQNVYTNQDHSLGSSRQHLYMEMERFLDNCWST